MGSIVPNSSPSSVSPCQPRTVSASGNNGRSPDVQETSFDSSNFDSYPFADFEILSRNLGTDSNLNSTADDRRRRGSNWNWTDDCISFIKLKKSLIVIGLLVVAIIIFAGLIVSLIVIQFQIRPDSTVQTASQKLSQLTPIRNTNLGHCSTPVAVSSELLTKRQLKLLDNVINLEECGGLIKIPRGLAEANSFIVEYKAQQNNVNSEPEQKKQCLWTLDNIDGEGRFYQLKVNVTLLCVGSESDLLSMIDWKRNRDFVWNLAHTELNLTATNYKSINWDYKLFLSYTSTLNSSTAGSTSTPGFRVQIDVLRTLEDGTGSNFVITVSPGKESFGPFSINDYFTLALNPPHLSTRVTVSCLGFNKEKVCDAYDTLDLYEIASKGSPKILTRICSNMKAPVTFSSEYAILAFFHTQDTTIGTEGGFSLTWE